MEELKIGDRVSYLRYDQTVESTIKQIKTVSSMGKPLPTAIAVLANGTTIPLPVLTK